MWTFIDLLTKVINIIYYFVYEIILTFLSDVEKCAESNEVLGHFALPNLLIDYQFNIKKYAAINSFGLHNFVKQRNVWNIY